MSKIDLNINILDCDRLLKSAVNRFSSNFNNPCSPELTKEVFIWKGHDPRLVLTDYSTFPFRPALSNLDQNG